MSRFERMQPGENEGEQEPEETTASEEVAPTPRTFAHKVLEAFSDRYPFGPITGPVNPADGKLYNTLRALADDSPAFNPNNPRPDSDDYSARHPQDDPAKESWRRRIHGALARKSPREEETPPTDALAEAVKHVVKGLTDFFAPSGPLDKAIHSDSVNSAYELLGPPPEKGSEETLKERAYRRVQATPPEERTEPGWRILEGLAKEYDQPE